jgi:hypothetical protein
MPALQIRGVPESIRDALAAEASARGQSMQAFLLELLETHARRLRNADVLNRFADRSDGSRVVRGAAAAELAEQRKQRRTSGHVA